MPRSFDDQRRAGEPEQNTTRARGAGPSSAAASFALAPEERLGAGAPLDASFRSQMERRLGHDLSGVRIHAGGKAAAAADELDARAFTVGSHVALGAGEGQSGTPEGSALLAHELAHVVQQSRGPADAEPLHEGSAAHEALERDADAAAVGIAPRSVQRQQRAAANRAARRLPPVRIQPDESTWAGGWFLEFDTWVGRDELAAALFVKREVPDGFTLEPTRTGEKSDYFSLRWTVRWPSPLSAHLGELTPYAIELRDRTSTGGEMFEEDVWRRDEEREAARLAKIEHDKTYVPALGMTGAEALRTLKPGIYVAGPGRPRVTVPNLDWRDERPDVSWMREYLPDGVLVWVSPAEIQIRGLDHPADETFWADLIWFMQHGQDLHTAEKSYVALMDELIREMLIAMIMAYSTAPSIGPRANVAEEALSVTAGRGGFGKLGMLGHIDPLEALSLAFQTYAVVLTDLGVIEDAQRRAKEDERRAAEEAHERGDLYQLPVFVATDAAVEYAEAPTAAAPAGTIQRAPRGRGQRASSQGLSVRERVDGFVNDVAETYRDDIADAKARMRRATPSRIGQEAEKATLSKVERIAQRWGLKPERIWIGDTPVGVTGPKGGVISAEVASTKYKFMIELKKSPQAVRAYQATAQLLAIEEGFNFPEGSRYFRIYGEGFERGGAVVEHEAPPRSTTRSR